MTHQQSAVVAIIAASAVTLVSLASFSVGFDQGRRAKCFTTGYTEYPIRPSTAPPKQFWRPVE